MRRAFLVTGFNNWGKSSLIFDLFERGRFSKEDNYSIGGINASFTVKSHSNDDLATDRYLREISERLDASKKKKPDFFGALCPTAHSRNDSKSILSTDLFTQFDEIHLLLLKYKWDLHAELRIQAIQDHLQPISNLRFGLIEDDPRANTNERKKQRKTAAFHYISRIYR